MCPNGLKKTVADFRVDSPVAEIWASTCWIEVRQVADVLIASYFVILYSPEQWVDFQKIGDKQILICGI